jgi:hypothetical protein
MTAAMGFASRFLAVDAGPYALALPLSSVRQILDVGGDQATAPSDPRALGVLPISLARLLGAAPRSDRQGLLLFDGLTGPVLLSTCALRGVFDADPPRPLPETVACRWPGLVTGLVAHAPAEGLLAKRLALDARFLMGLVENVEGAPMRGA